MKRNLTNDRKFKLISIGWSSKGHNWVHKLERLLYQRTLNTREQNNTSQLMHLRYLLNNALYHKSGTGVTGRGVPHISTAVCSTTLVYCFSHLIS